MQSVKGRRLSRKAGPAELNPEILHQLHFSFVPSQVLSAALRLGVFSAVAAGRHTVPAVARAGGANERGMRMLLDALIPLGLIRKRGARYGLTPLSERYLVRKSPDYLGAFFEDGALWSSWSQLTDVIRTGEPVHRVGDQREAERFFPVLIRTLHALQRELALRAARALSPAGRRKDLRVLDIACGSGVWSIPYAELNPRARVTAQDYPAVLKVTRQYLKRHGVSRQYDFLPGDLKTVELGVGRYDLAILGNIVHSEGEKSSRQLFRRLHRALGAGGRVVIVDMVPNDERTGPPFPLFFALNMLLNTEAGDTYTLGEYSRWLKGAGFARVDTREIGSHSPLIIATK